MGYTTTEKRDETHKKKQHPETGKRESGFVKPVWENSIGKPDLQFPAVAKSVVMTRIREPGGVTFDVEKFEDAELGFEELKFRKPDSTNAVVVKVYLENAIR